jgi:hypothetical protein
VEKANAPLVVLFLEDGGLKPLHWSGDAGRAFDRSAIDVGDPGDFGFAVAGDVNLRVVDGPDIDVALVLKLFDVVEDGVALELVAAVEDIEVGSYGLVEAIVVVFGRGGVHGADGLRDGGIFRRGVRAGVVLGVGRYGEDQHEGEERRERSEVFCAHGWVSER